MQHFCRDAHCDNLFHRRKYIRMMPPWGLNHCLRLGAWKVGTHSHTRCLSDWFVAPDTVCGDGLRDLYDLQGMTGVDAYPITRCRVVPAPKEG